MRALTVRELAVAVAFAQGLTYPEVAARFGFSEDGAKKHSEAIRRKLGVEKTRDIRRALVAQGLATPEEVVG